MFRALLAAGLLALSAVGARAEPAPATSDTKPAAAPAGPAGPSTSGAKAPSAPAGPAVPVPPDMAMGSAKAPVTVIEYASVTCPHCARWETEVFPAFKRKYIDTGEVRYVLREFPTEPEELAEAGFMIARCSGPQKYFDVIQTFMAGQTQLYQTRDARTWLLKGGSVGGLTEPQVKTCIEDQSGQKALAERITANAKAFNVQGTPTFIVNGKMLGDGEVTLAELDKAIAAANGKPAGAPAVSAKPKPRPKRKGG